MKIGWIRDRKSNPRTESFENRKDSDSRTFMEPGFVIMIRYARNLALTSSPTMATFDINFVFFSCTSYVVVLTKSTRVRRKKKKNNLVEKNEKKSCFINRGLQPFFNPHVLIENFQFLKLSIIFLFLCLFC